MLLAKSVLPLLLLSLPAAVSLVGPDTIPGPCSKKPYYSGLKAVVFQRGKGALLTCDKRQRSYIKVPIPTDNALGKIHFGSYKCVDNHWENDDMYYSSKALRCAMGCMSPAKSDFLHAFSEDSDCERLNEKGDSVNVPAYIYCEIRCKDGYYSNSQAQNQVNNQRVYCEETFGIAYWVINEGFDLEPFVKCVHGCFIYGSDREDVFGMIANFKSIGEIDGVKRYASGEVMCDSHNGYFPVSDDLSESVLLTCASGDHWEPVKARFYCKKGCRKPGGSFGGEKIVGYSFGCSDGVNGWYIECAFSCNSEDSYTMVGRAGRLPEGPMAEVLVCTDGRFDLSHTRNKCERQCSPPQLMCPSGYACTGYVRDHAGKDTGKRYCVRGSHGVPTTQRLTESTQSFVSSFMVNVFGSYDWLM